MAYAELYETNGLKGSPYQLLKAAERTRKQNEKNLIKVTGSDKTIMRIQGVKVNTKYIRESLSYNVVDYLNDMNCPVLAITGGKDIQVIPEDVKNLTVLVKGEVEWHILADMNHFLRKYKGEHTMIGLMKEYQSQLSKAIDSDLLDKLGEWLRRFAVQLKV